MNILLRFILLISLIISHGCSHGPRLERGLENLHRGLATRDRNYQREFRIVREVLTRDHVKEFLNEILEGQLEVGDDIKQMYDIPKESQKMITETQFLRLLDTYPRLSDVVEKYLQDFPVPHSDGPSKNEIKKITAFESKVKSILQKGDVLDNFQNKFDPLSDYELDGTHRNMEIYFNHPSLVDGVEVPPEKQPRDVIIEFIQNVEKEVALSVFDFDDMKIAETLIAAKKRGVNVRVGIDADVIHEKDGVLKVYKKLQESGVEVTAVDATGLSHQKMITRDWSLKEKGAVIFSSGNFTTSGLHPNGDLGDLPVKHRYSIPNANHVVFIESDQVSNLVNHNLTYTLDMKLRGAEYPMNGVFRSKDVDGNYIRIAFTPGGALKNVNENLIAQEIEDNAGKGPMTMVQFAFSADEVSNAALNRAKKEGKDAFEFIAIGDTSFSMRGWSEFLTMSGMEQITDDLTGIKYYREDEDSPWRKLLGEDGLDKLRKSILVAPEDYGDHHVEIDGKKVHLTSKIHHKGATLSNRAAIVGTSFNFSAGAVTNNEQVLVVYNKRIVDKFRNGNDWLIKNSKGTVYDEAMKRSQFRIKQNEILHKHIAHIYNYITTTNDSAKAEKLRLKAMDAIDKLESEIGMVKARDIIVRIGEAPQKSPQSSKLIYSSFAWDENIFKDTKSDVRIRHIETGKELGLSVEQFSLVRDLVGVEGTEYENYMIEPEKAFRFYDENTNVGSKRLFNSVVEALDGERGSFKGPFWNAFTNSMRLNSTAKNTEIVFRGRRTKKSIMEMFKYLKRVGEIQNLPDPKNIKIIPFEGEKENHSSYLLDRLNNIEHSLDLKSAPQLISPSGTERGKFAVFVYSDSNYKNFKMNQEILQSEIDKGRFKNIKISMSYTGRKNKEVEPFGQVLVKDRPPREQTLIEVVEWKRMISRGSKVKYSGSSNFCTNAVGKYL